MKEYVIKLIPRSSFETELHSDTLFGAICWGIRTLFGEEKLHSVLSEFSSKPPFLVSSAFPCRVDKDKFYIPILILKPLTHEELRNDFDFYIEKAKTRKIYNSDKVGFIKIVSEYKKFKKIKWLDVEYFSFPQGNVNEKKLFEYYLKGLLVKIKHSSNESVQKNSLDRLTNSTGGSGNTFYNDEIYYKNKWGLYFLLRTNSFKELLLPVLKLLEDSGIGSNARTGKNWFKIVNDNTENRIFKEVNGQNVFIALSRCVLKDINVENSSYGLSTIRSKIESRWEFAGEDIWKSRITYFNEGSLIYVNEKKEFYGGIYPVKEIAGKTIYQYGYAYPLWIN